MSRTLTKIIAAVPVCAAAAAGGGMLMVGPGKYTAKAAEPFAHRYFAHRGLYKEDQSVPENSLKAFGLAVEKGYGIELDIQLSKEGEVVVMHDDDLKRACGVDRPVSDLTLAELKELRLFGTEEQIPLFSEVLALVNGAVPLIVELKSQGPRNAELSLKARDMLFAYRGDYCIESFDPRIVRWFRMNAPWIFRGQLACPKESYNDDTPAAAKEIFSRCLCNFYGRPQFIAYEVGRKPGSVRFAEAMGAFRVCWTSHGKYDEKDTDAVIFEHYLP